MSLLDTLWKAGKKAANALHENNKEIQELKQKYKSLPDDDLLFRYRSSFSNLKEKMALSALLKERGYADKLNDV